MIRLTRKTLLSGLFAAGALAALPIPPAAANDEYAEYDRWAEVKPMYFGDKPVGDGSDVIALDAPYRAHDAALVPIEVVNRLPADGARRIKAITLLVENNPIPLAGTFRFPSDRRIERLSTRVRVESYSFVRAVAELDDGSLVKTGKFVKASGGCSAAAMKDPETVMARLGKMKLRSSKPDSPNGPMQAQFMISHPNYNGMQFDQISRHYIPAHYVEDLRIAYAGEPLIAVEADVSLSEDPTVRFTFEPQGTGRFKVSVKDTEGQTFKGDWNPFADSGA